MTVTTINSTDARYKMRDMLDGIIAKAGGYIIERYKRPIAILLPFDEYERLRQAEADLLLKRSDEIRSGDYVTQDEIDRALGN